jgi:hypothetical protein
MPTPVDIMAMAQELRDLLSLHLAPVFVVEEKMERIDDATVVYTVDSTDETAVSSAVKKSVDIFKVQREDIDVKAEGVAQDPQRYRATITLTTAPESVAGELAAHNAAVKTADTSGVLPVALQVGEHLFGLEDQQGKVVVLQDGIEVGSGASTAEAFGLLFTLAVPVFWTALFPTRETPDDQENQINRDRDIIDGIMPLLLASPAVQGDAADLLISFYEAATLRKAPPQDA